MTDLECSPYLLLPRRTLAEVEAQRRTRLLADAEALRGRAMMEQCKPHADEWKAFELRRAAWRLEEEAQP